MVLFPDGRTFVIILIAGVFEGFVRGYSGRGFALAAMPILTTALSPATAVPAIFPLGCAIGLLTQPAERANINLSVLKWLALGAIVGAPVGMIVLALVPAELMRVVLGVAVAVAAFRAWRGEREAAAKSPANLASIGFPSGVTAGLAALKKIGLQQ